MKMNDRRNQDRKATPKDKIIGGIIMTAFGLFWMISGNSMMADSPFGNGPSLMINGFGILFIIVALANVFSGINELKKEQQEALREFEERAERQKQGKPAPAPAAVNAEKSREKKIVYCPYCGTAQKEDYMVCESCGAGRKK